MEGEPAGNGTTPATSRATARRLPDPHVDERLLLEALLTYALNATSVLNATSAARPRSRSNGQQPTAPARAEEEPLGLIKMAESAEGDVPGSLVSPVVGKSHLAWARLAIALCSVALLVFVVVAAFATIWRGQDIDILTRLLEIIFAPIVVVVGAAVAFYYKGSSL
jgi:hypothetical protein